MSHFKERKEKNCLNCNAVVAGKYCQVCGQENIIPKESFWHLVTHFFNDITHFDGKFFTTTKLLLLKPGFLPREYLRGKRASYLHPIRMYVFTSAIFFLLLFTITGGQETQSGENAEKKMLNEKKMGDIDSIMAGTKDTTLLLALAKQKDRYRLANNAIDSIRHALTKEKKENRKEAATDSLPPAVVIKTADSLLQNLNDPSDENVSDIGFIYSVEDSIKSVAQYEKQQASLPADKRDGWFEKPFIKKGISIAQKYRYNLGGYNKLILEKFLHSLPQMFFVSLPLFALILQLLYIRRKEFYYTDHGVFSIYHFIAVFIIWLWVLLFTKLGDVTGWGIFKYLTLASILFILFYLYKSMRNFYQQRRAKTILKFVLLCTISGTITGFLTMGFLLLTFLNVK